MPWDNVLKVFIILGCHVGHGILPSKGLIRVQIQMLQLWMLNIQSNSCLTSLPWNVQHSKPEPIPKVPSSLRLCKGFMWEHDQRPVQKRQALPAASALALAFLCAFRRSVPPTRWSPLPSLHVSGPHLHYLLLSCSESDLYQSNNEVRPKECESLRPCFGSNSEWFEWVILNTEYVAWREWKIK